MIRSFLAILLSCITQFTILNQLYGQERQSQTSTYEEFVPQNPLKTPETSSPKATVKSFVENINGAYYLLMKAKTFRDSPSDRVEMEKLVSDAEILFSRSVYCLNLSEVPSSFKRNEGYEAALILKGIIDRVGIPPFDSIPDKKLVLDDLENNKFPTLIKWNIPNTNIVIEKVNEGERYGQYLFSPATIKNLKTYYLLVEDLPYLNEPFVTPDFYEIYKRTPGKLFPPLWSRFLPEWSKTFYYSQTIWQWCILLLSSITLVFLFAIISIRLRRYIAGLSSVKKSWYLVFFNVLMIVVINMTKSFYLNTLNITGFTRLVLNAGLTLLIIITSSLLIYRLAIAVSTSLTLLPKIKTSVMRVASIRASFMVIGIALAFSYLIYGLLSIGVSLLPLLTSIGIAGFAVALAAQETLSNVIGSFTLFADNPFKVGDLIKFSGETGTIQNIGLRTTQIRGLNGHMFFIPNRKMIDREIENLSERPFIRRVFSISLPSSTSSEKINKALAIVRNILSVPQLEDGKEDVNHPNMAVNNPEYPPKVAFNDFNSDSLNIVVFYWYFPPEYFEYLAHADQINSRIVKQFNDAGIEFALPSQKVQVDNNSIKPKI